MTLVPVDTTSALAVSDYLDKAKQWLATAVEMTGPAEIASAKAEIATAAEATKQLGLSKDIQLDAQEMVRRAEYALGRAIRKGQAEGTVQSGGRPETSTSRRSSLVGDFIPHKGSVRESIYAISDNLAPGELDEVLDEAKAEGNVSRANVARKAREKSGKPPVTERNFQEAELVTAFRVNVRPLLKPKNVSTLSPRARALLIDLLQEAIETLKGADE